ncbi:MAG: hypothetical protein IIA65_04155, partial [Planctomycetes bacterium]|nr:hypothetical protein [Planctomycetota bacterium]
ERVWDVPRIRNERNTFREEIVLPHLRREWRAAEEAVEPMTEALAKQNSIIKELRAKIKKSSKDAAKKLKIVPL